jgi:AraC-like DNA-binding protein
METEINKKRLQNMSCMLLEMAGGNFAYRIQRTSQDDALESLTMLLNMTAEELRSSVSHQGFVNPHHTYTSHIQTTFILDLDFVIKSFNSDALTMLGFTPETIHGRSFDIILSEESLSCWNNAKKKLSEDNHFSTTLELVYVTQNQLLVPVFCSISRLMHCEAILISSVKTVIEDPLHFDISFSSHETKKTKELYRYSDVQLIQKVYDYISNHLDSPLPSIKELSRIFGTNEYKLKYGFKQLFQTSIYQFYNNERLKKSHLLIQQTTLPLKKIAFMTGFSSYPNFSKAFKKSFGYAPYDIKRG